MQLTDSRFGKPCILTYIFYMCIRGCNARQPEQIIGGSIKNFRYFDNLLCVWCAFSRTLDAAYTEILKDDPQTNLSKYALREILLSGKIPTVQVHRMRLVDMAVLSAYLSGGTICREEGGENQKHAT
ncbi:MAG: hypothetical protein FWG90_08440 [Oscillospiraceae bacterium]|nr:hypothetical protein [Oscillospiraceae bacterium]